ncbi:MAG: HEAT repeat domain-containing protein [Bryobacteraceae bacterium]
MSTRLGDGGCLSLAALLSFLSIVTPLYSDDKPPTLETRAQEILTTALKEHNPDTRRQAVIALSLAASREQYFNYLDDALSDKDVPVKLAVVGSLTEIAGPKSITLLRRALEDSVPEVSFAAARALWQRHDPAGRDALVAVVDKEAKASSGFFTEQKREALRMMQTPRTLLFFSLRMGIGFVPVPGLGEGVASMQGLLSDPGVSGRASAALMLARDKDPAVRAAIEDALDDKDWSVRAAAVHALALQNDPRVEKRIIPLLDDKREAVRLRAAAACLRLESLRHGKPAPKVPKATPVKPSV